MKSILIHILSVVCLCGCSRASQVPGVDRSAAAAVPGGPGEYVLPSSISSLTTFGQWLGRPFSWDDEPSAPIDRLSLKGELASDGTAFDKRIVISIDGKNVSVDGKAEGVKVKSIGGNVSINSSAEGVEFVVRGHSSKGNIRIKSDKVALLTLDGLDLTSNSGEALQSKGKATLVISCSEGTENVLRDRKRSSKNLKEEKFKACVSAHGDIILTGKGSLTVTANQKNGIETDKRLVVEDLVRLTIDSCANNAIKATGGFRMDGGQVVLSPSANGVTSKHGDIDIRGGFLKVWTSGEASKALKSDGNVSVSGGELRLICTGKSRHTDTDYKASAAIRADSSFVMTGGLVKCYANGEGGKGVNADGEVRISGGRLLVICEGGMAGSDFIYSLPKGIKADGKVVISGGEVAVRATGGDGSEGIESKDEVKITGGDVTSLAYDDAINAKSRIFVSGGTVIAYSLENDGFDSNGALAFTGGTAISAGAHMPEEGFDTDEGDFVVGGGTLFGIGGSTSRPTESLSKQPSLIVGARGAEGDNIDVLDGTGNLLFHYRLDRDYSPMTILFSCPQMKVGDKVKFSQAESSDVKLEGVVTTIGELPGPPAGQFGMPPMGGDKMRQ